MASFPGEDPSERFLRGGDSSEGGWKKNDLLAFFFSMQIDEHRAAFRERARSQRPTLYRRPAKQENALSGGYTVRIIALFFFPRRAALPLLVAGVPGAGSATSGFRSLYTSTSFAGFYPFWWHGLGIATTRRQPPAPFLCK